MPEPEENLGNRVLRISEEQDVFQKSAARGALIGFREEERRRRAAETKENNR